MVYFKLRSLHTFVVREILTVWLGLFTAERNNITSNADDYYKSLNIMFT